MTRRRGGGKAVAGAVAMSAVVVLGAQTWTAGQARAAGQPAPYTFAEGAQRTKGAASTSEAPRLTAGATYRDSIDRGEKLVYRIDLDAERDAYVSAVAVPEPGTKVAFADGLEVSLQDRDGYECSSNDSKFGSAEFPRPLAAYAHRTIEKDRTSCQKADSYYVVIERSASDDKEAAASPKPWELEIRHQIEPKVKEVGPTAAPSAWPSASPPPPAGGPRERPGGAGFFDATGLTQGEWTDRIEPGQSRFYRVPVDWGQQIFASADLGSADLGSSAGQGYVGNALSMTLFNPMQGVVGSADSVSYDGKQKAAALDPLPPVRYENRFDSSAKFEDMRFAGWYYLRVSLSPEVGEEFGKKPYGLTLRVNVRGEARPAPAYDGPAGIFAVTQDDKEQAASGQSGSEAERSDTMKVVAAAGIGSGTVLLLGLGVWTLLARRRAAPTG
ncbi:hypothetical protein ACIRNI_04145 [Streptomyces sp. NPDC093546]|uniref:hypothetical protein n=1 Tax=Streptomyces sp. NPDC093546 TaxID=3366040 RepID=UPI00382390C1